MRPAIVGRVVLGLVALVAAFALGAACAALGYTDRMLWRVPSPDGRLVAVCQEIPMLDGPGYDVRLERPDGTAIRHLYQSGDGDPCSELAWSADGRTLAVLSSHVARIMIVDVAWAVEHPTAKSVPWRTVGLGREGNHTLGRNLRFVGTRDLELEICPYSLPETQQTRQMRCLRAAELKRFECPPLPATGS